MDGLAQAVGSGPGPGTLSPPVNVFFFFALYSLQPCQSKKMVLQCVFCRVSVCLRVCVHENACASVCVVLISVSQKYCGDH